MKTIKATYDRDEGVFRPKEAIDLPTGAMVDVHVPEDRVEATRAHFAPMVGTISEEDLDLMVQEIEETCERNDERDGK